MANDQLRTTTPSTAAVRSVSLVRSGLPRARHRLRHPRSDRSHQQTREACSITQPSWCLRRRCRLQASLRQSRHTHRSKRNTGQCSRLRTRRSATTHWLQASAKVSSITRSCLPSSSSNHSSCSTVSLRRITTCDPGSHARRLLRRRAPLPRSLQPRARWRRFHRSLLFTERPTPRCRQLRLGVPRTPPSPGRARRSATARRLLLINPHNININNNCSCIRITSSISIRRSCVRRRDCPNVHSSICILRRRRSLLKIRRMASKSAHFIKCVRGDSHKRTFPIGAYARPNEERQ